ncbi:EAL domain-containing protein [Granulosicoccus antarcticus]|uniref:Cyclic di-GMP phosphodiesterase Gmr n=1 Tax=Granulosicoccus antarcticus IMCC3135 TaxID=1192854 RepID=A0A2Z2NXB9_9GAMM|nr:EAL domain-containing protein [Granulosicoccus antarcticus]ASJ75999.1 Cyclic di-GMP phosphodiesterase Gmr [Granulosicoccus antarcticus IMCC3135]
MGIRAKLVLCLLAVLLPIVAVSLVTINLLENQLVERTESSLSNTQRLEAARINEILTTYAQDARNLASDTHVKEFVDASNEFRQARLAGHDTSTLLNTSIGGIDGIAIIDLASDWPLQQLALALQRKAGIVGSNIVELRIVDITGKTLGETMGYTWEPIDSDLLTRSINTVKTSFGEAFLSVSDQTRLGIVSPIIANSGEVVGALMLETRLNPIVDLISKHEQVSKSSEAHIAQPMLNGDAQFLTELRFDRTSAFSKIIPKSKNLPINQALDAPRGRILHARDYRGVDSILAIETIPATGWGLVVKVDTSEAFGPVNELRHVLMITTFSSIAFVLVCYMFCLVPIAQRLKRTAAAAHKIMSGDLTTRVNDFAQDEIGNLARTIDTLARDLESDQQIRTEVEARLRHQALHDELTGLLNRKYANNVIEQLNNDRQSQHSVMFLDLNGFKDVNDLYGHAAGDEVLITVSQRLSDQIGDGVTLARWGGDEFVVILPGCGEAAATETALSLHCAFDEAITTSKGLHQLSCSIGLATSSETKSLDDVLMEADILMYEQKKAKQNARSRGSMATRTVERALKEDRLEIWFQPIVSFKRPGTYALAGAEAFVRIRSRDGGIVLPQDFMNDVESIELGTELDRRVLTRALSSLARWRASGVVGEDFRLSLNLTAHSLNEPEFSATLQNQLKASAVKPEQVIIELPPNAAVDPLLLAHLRMLGVAVALDKLGTDPMNLGHTARLQPDIAKIDRRLLSDAIVAPHVVSICEERRLDIIVEGVETREQMAALHNLGVTYFQGYLFDRPQRGVDFITRWGKSSSPSVGERLNRDVSLRLAG